MKGTVKAVLILMVILTVIYASTVVYVNTTTSLNLVYAADLYKSGASPSNWYTPDQLGIVDIIEYEANNSCWLHVVVDRDKEPFPLQREQPIFLYKDRFFQVSPLWATPRPPEGTQQWQVLLGGVLGVGWIFTGALFLKWRKKK